MSAAPHAAPPDLHVESHGRGEPAVALVHGFGANAHFWRHWVPHLAGRHRTHVVDLLGAGASPAPPDGDYSPEGQARCLTRWIRNQEGAPPVLVGHSVGAGIALLSVLRLATEAPEIRLPGLILVSGAVYPQPFPRYLTLARTPGLRCLVLLAAPPRPLLRLGIRGIVRRRDCIDEAMVEGYRRPLRHLARRRVLLRAARQLDLEAADALAARLREIEPPTLVLWGADDPVVPVALGRRLANELPNADLVIIPGIGHLPPEEDPVGTVAPVLTFLDALPNGSAPPPQRA